eukprot:CAMPEP_0194063090 /NCGR_PEP_ID=MMETSP0009_2-20130614/79409_1 /TAXON_ID=210454 /ORGANISM="Grammatophora oceanica, Strain CCMP 410" /LENGTH=38 /DNA_ID= /DNA_START= /DNA_END= /DNA_ORIENTATION=
MATTEDAVDAETAKCKAADPTDPEAPTMSTDGPSVLLF